MLGLYCFCCWCCFLCFNAFTANVCCYNLAGVFICLSYMFCIVSFVVSKTTLPAPRLPAQRLGGLLLAGQPKTVSISEYAGES